MAFLDDFNRADSAGLGNNWTEQSDIYGILGGQARSSGGGVNWKNSCIRPTGEQWENGTVEVEFTVAAAFQTYPRLEARFTMPGGIPQYYATYATSTTLYIGRYQSSSWNTIGSQAISPALSVGTKYRLTFILNGSSLTAELREASSGDLLASKNVTSSHITGPGRQGFGTGATATQPTDFDNFSSSELIDAVKSLNDEGTGADIVSVADTSSNMSAADSGTGADGVVISASVPQADGGQGADSVSIAVFLGVGDIGSGTDAPSIVEPAMLSLLERFDGTLDDWAVDTSGGTALIQTVDNDEKLVLNGISGAGVVSATRAIEGQSAPFCFEADIYAASGAAGVIEALDAAGNVLFSVKADGAAGLGTFDTDNDTASTFSLSAATYYQVVFYCETLTDIVKAWHITGSGASPSAWTAIGAAKGFSGALVSKIRLATDQTATGEVRFDEVRVFRPNVFCIGDSNTAGYKSSSPYWNPVPSAPQRVGSGEDETHSYPHWLGLKFGPGQWVANRGLNSDKSADVDGRIQGDVIDQGCQTVVILIGTNDITAGVALSTIEANIQSAANKGASAGCTVCLCSVPPRNAWDATQNAKRDGLNSWIQSHAAASGYRFADVYTAVRDSGDPDIINSAYDAGDGLHFTTAGLQAVADTVYSALLETKPVVELAAAVDFIEVRNFLALADSGTGSDAIALRNFIALVDSGAASEGFGINVAVELLELASSVEALVSGAARQDKSIGDTASGADAVSAIIRDGATLQDVYNLTLTRLSSAAYVAPDNAATTELLGHAVAMSKWKNNRLARTSVSGRIETWVLYDDDGTTPLLTWTHDASTRTRERAY